jgi:hypothetical protein
VRLARVLRMPPSEIAFRGRGEAYKWLDRLGALSLFEGANVGAAADFVRFHESGRATFFAGAVGEDTPHLLAAHAPGAAEPVRAVADEAAQGRFDLLGYRGLRFGDPIDWHLDPVAGRRAPLVHWSRVRPLDPDCVGDSKVVWELNRHQWMVALAQAYRLTGDEGHASVVTRRLQEWWAANPRGRGVNWTSSLELALRLIAWCWTLVLLRGSRHLTNELIVQVRRSIGEHAAHIETYLSRYFSPNTHLTGEALGLFYAGVVFPDLPAAARWKHLGTRLLIEESERQILADGVYFEQSTAYQCYTAEIYIHFLVLARRHGVMVPADVAARVTRLLDFLLFVRQPDGRLPAIGDADGGRLLPLVPRPPHDARGLFALGAAVFGRADYAWAAGGVAPELVWMLGNPGVETFQRLEPHPPATSPSRVFPDGGYAVMRSGWDPQAHQLIFDVGPLGCPTSAGHGHADLLSLQVSAFGEPFLVDPGTYVYTPDLHWRGHFRSSSAHNTVTVDGESQARPAGAFSWKERPETRLRQWRDEDGLTLAEAEHDAYARLDAPVRHRRRVRLVRRTLWVIEDELDGRGPHLVEQHFQFAPVDVTLEADGWVRARSRSGRCLWLRPQPAPPLSMQIHTGTIDPPAGWISPDYGQRVPAPKLVVSARAALPFRVVTLLVPRDVTEEQPPVVDGEEIGL